MPALAWEHGRLTNRWRARVKCLGTYYSLGRFDTREAAKAAEDEWWAKKGFKDGERSRSREHYGIYK